MCAFGNQVEIEASSAKFGKRSASMLPVRAQQVVERELVEDHDHDRGRSALPAPPTPQAASSPAASAAGEHGHAATGHVNGV